MIPNRGQVGGAAKSRGDGWRTRGAARPSRESVLIAGAVLPCGLYGITITDLYRCLGTVVSVFAPAELGCC